MTAPHPFGDDELDPETPAGERAALIALAERLAHERPPPRAGFRAELQAWLRGLARSGAPRPRWLWQRVVVLALSGAGLLGLVALGVAGAGPFSP
jgi:hypothetical protein